MRILLISRCPPWPLYLGDRLIVYHLAQELEARGHQVDLLAFYDRPDDPQQVDHYDQYFGSVQLIPEPRRSRLSYLRRLLLSTARWPRRPEDSWSPEMWRAIEAALGNEADRQKRVPTHPDDKVGTPFWASSLKPSVEDGKRDYDIVHLFGGIQVYEFFHALNNHPTIITPYESYSLYLRRQLKNTQPSTFNFQLLTFNFQVARRFESFMFRPYRRTVVVSEPDRDELLALNPALPLEVIPNGVDTYTFRPRPTRRIPTLLFVGNYEYAPNVDAALRLATEIFPAVQKSIPNVRLWLVGNAPPPELRALASDSVRVTGRVPDVRPYLARAGVFVSPLRLGAGIKNKVLEALAMGCPVVATPLSVDGISVQHGQEALIANSNELVEQIVRVLQDESLRQRLAVNGRKLIESRYSWDSVAESYEQLYRAVINPEPSSP
jgi:glycosyltransferase involved in cell wall biosynthesis